MPAFDELRTIALPYWARPGFMLATDDESGGGGDDEDDDTDDDDDDEADDPDAEKSDEELRTELKEVRKRLEGANDKGKRNRLKARELQKQLDERGREKAKPKSDDDEDKVDPAEVRRQALADARSESDTRIKKGAVRAELRAAGITTEQLARVAGMVNLDDLDVDDNGEVDGIDEAVSDLKSEFPQLFGLESGKRRRPSVTGPSDEQRGGGKRKLSVDQQLANQLLGKH
jgi:hypothetical protein